MFFTSEGFPTSPPGSYAIQPIGFSQNPNYQLQFVNGTLTIVTPPPVVTNPYLAPVVFLPGTLNPTNPTLTDSRDAQSDDPHAGRDQPLAGENNCQSADRHTAAALRPAGRDGARAIGRVVQSAGG